MQSLPTAAGSPIRRPLGAFHIWYCLPALFFTVNLAGTAFAADFETLTKQAGRLNETKEGAVYMDKCQDVLHRYISAAMDACGPKYPDTKEPAFIALVVAADGHVTQRLSSPGIAYSECLMSHFPSSLLLPPPPRDGWPVVIGMENRFHAVAAGKAAGGSRAALADYDSAIAPYVAQGRETYPGAKKRFLAGLPAGNRFLVRIRLRQANKVEESFVQVTGIASGQVSGVVDGVAVVTNYRKGQRITFSESDIKDWVIQHPDGSQEGNVVGKFLNQSKH